MIYNFNELSFQILLINRFFHKNGFFNVDRRPFAALSLRVSGSGEFEVGNKCFTSNPGDILFIPSGVSYNVKYFEGESIVIHLSECNYTTPENINLDIGDLFHEKFIELLDYWQNHHQINGTKALIYNLLQLIEQRKTSPITDSNFIRCVSYINRNFCNPKLELSEICREGFISESGLRRKFHRYYDMSPKQYILELRLNKAMELLTDGRISVKEASERCGFADEKYFSRVIKNKYGQSPSAFNKKSAL